VGQGQRHGFARALPEPDQAGGDPNGGHGLVVDAERRRLGLGVEGREPRHHPLEVVRGRDPEGAVDPARRRDLVEAVEPLRVVDACAAPRALGPRARERRRGGRLPGDARQVGCRRDHGIHQRADRVERHRGDRRAEGQGGLHGDAPHGTVLGDPPVATRFRPGDAVAHQGQDQVVLDRTGLEERSSRLRRRPHLIGTVHEEGGHGPSSQAARSGDGGFPRVEHHPGTALDAPLDARAVRCRHGVGMAVDARTGLRTPADLRFLAGGATVDAASASRD
jgi:hypothetical protein